MDKYEYKIRANEIKQLIEQGEYVQAAEIADTVDWRRVKSVMMLCMISDLYKINRRYEDARDMLLLAYERRPGGRTICYSLCELSIKMEEYVQAIEYYKEYVQAAPSPMDPGRYILQYKLYEAQDVSLEERIAVLEKLKQCDYLPKWGYELAYLFHRVGLASRCVEECDELILWFGDGKYVIKAMELKMLHQPLTPEQQEKYDHRFDYMNVPSPIPAEEASQEEYYGENTEPAEGWQDEVGTQGYDGVQDYGNMQDYGATQSYDDTQSYGEAQYYDDMQGNDPVRLYDGSQSLPEQIPADPQTVGDSLVYNRVQEQKQTVQQSEELDIHVKTMDVGQYNTINLQAELAAGLREVLEGEKPGKNIEDRITRSIVSPMIQNDTETLDYPDTEEAGQEPTVEEMEGSEVFFGETGEISSIQMDRIASGKNLQGQNSGEQGKGEVSEDVAAVPQNSAVPDITAEIVMEQMRRESNRDNEQVQAAEVMRAEPPKALAQVLSQESDGQISLVVPERETIEKQITGQISLEDILSEWERMKQENQEKRAAEVRQHVLQQTGTMFTEFEASVRDGLLEQLERGRDVEGLAEASAVEPAVEEAAKEESVSGEETFADEDIQPVEEAAGETLPEEEALADEEMQPVEEAFADEGMLPEEEALADETMLLEEEAARQEASVEEPAFEEQGADGIASVEGTSALKHPPVVEREKAKVRSLTREEKELYAPFIQSRAAREQLVKTIDGISLAAYTGNVIITGEEGMDTLSLAKNIIREVQAEDSNFSGKAAKISGASLNRKDVAATLAQLKNGALIIEKASGMNRETADALYRSLQQENMGIVIVLEDTRKAMDKLLSECEKLKNSFTARMDVEALSNDMLVAFGKQYAREKEYSIDTLGILALHTRIEDMQTIDHVVTVVEVKEIVDDAIAHANRKTLGHFFDILLARRYDEEDMIILSEKDFV